MMGTTSRTNTPRSRDWRPPWDFADPHASEQRLRAECARLDAAGQRDEAAECRTQIARALGLQRRFDEAHRLLDEIERFRERPDHVRVLIERGRVLNSSRRSDEARPIFEQACEFASRCGEDDLAVDAAHMIAIVCEGEEATEWNIRALAMAERSGCPRARRWAGSLHNNLAWALHGLKRFDEALAIQQELRAAHEAAGSTDGFVCEELGECLLALGRGDEAAPWPARAHAALSQDPRLAEREPQRLARLAQLGGAGTGQEPQVAARRCYRPSPRGVHGTSAAPAL